MDARPESAFPEKSTETMNEIFENFSRKSWLLIDKSTVDSFVANFSLVEIQACDRWMDADAGDRRDALIMTRPVGGHVIVEGGGLVNEGRKISEEFSARSQTPVFNFSVDIWIPYMFYEFYENGRQIRRIEYDLNLEEGEVSCAESGERQAFEDNVQYAPDSPLGYDDFFYPLYLMHALDVKMPDIAQLLRQPSTTYLISMPR